MNNFIYIFYSNKEIYDIFKNIYDNFIFVLDCL